MMYHLSHAAKTFDAEINLPYSKSISNRLLMIQAMCHDSFEIINLSDANDTKLLAEAPSSGGYIPLTLMIAGTAFRFLTAFLAT